MEFIMQVCGAMLAVAGSLIALVITILVFYAVLIGIDTIKDEKKAKKANAKKKGGAK